MSELNTERDQIEIFIGREKDKYIEQGVHLLCVRWEEQEHSFHPLRIQDRFNESLLDCYILICLFFKKVGKYTREGFQKEYESFKEEKKPNHLYGFFKNVSVLSGDIDESFLEVLQMKNDREHRANLLFDVTSN